MNSRIINRVRWIVSIVLRCCSAAIGVAALVFLATNARQFLDQQKYFSVGTMPRPDLIVSFWPFLTATAVSLGFLALDRYAMQWLVPAQSSACAKCGYNLTGSATCPECNFPA